MVTFHAPDNFALDTILPIEELLNTDFFTLNSTDV